MDTTRDTFHYSAAQKKAFLVMSESPETENLKLAQRITDTSVQLTLVEVFLGSFLHGLKIPFGGHFLSLNQGFFLLRSAKGLRSRALLFKVPVYVSTVVATLKCLSPAGNKLGPMTSITVQGFLFAAGNCIFGFNWLGQTVGMLLLGLWAFFQPILTLYIIFGSDLLTAFMDNLGKLQKIFAVQDQTLWLLFFILIGVKCVLSVAVVILFRSKNENIVNEWIDDLSQKSKGSLTGHRPSLLDPADQESLSWFSRQATLGAIKDILKPFFIFSIVIMFLFFYSAGADWTTTLIGLLRPIAIGFLIFYIMRLNLVRPMLSKLKDRGYAENFIKTLESVVSRVF